MIILKNYEELEKYKKIIPADKNDGVSNVVLYEVIENDTLADVVIDFALDFSYMLYNDAKLLEDNLDQKFTIGKIVAKNIFFNYFIKIDCVEAKEASFKNNCIVEVVNVKDKLSGIKLQAKDIVSSNIDCKYISTCDICCDNLCCDVIKFSDKTLKNVKSLNIESLGCYLDDELPF